MLQVGSHWSRSTYQRVLVGSRAINTPHYLTTVPLARVAGAEATFTQCARGSPAPAPPPAARPFSVNQSIREKMINTYFTCDTETRSQTRSSVRPPCAPWLRRHHARESSRPRAASGPTARQPLGTIRTPRWPLLCSARGLLPGRRYGLT